MKKLLMCVVAGSVILAGCVYYKNKPTISDNTKIGEVITDTGSKFDIYYYQKHEYLYKSVGCTFSIQHNPSCPCHKVN